MALKKSQKSLKKWTKQDWGYSKKDTPGKGGKGVYLPKAKRAKLKSTAAGRKKLAAAERKKAAATRAGKQYAKHGLAKGTSLKKEDDQAQKAHHQTQKESVIYGNQPGQTRLPRRVRPKLQVL